MSTLCTNQASIIIKFLPRFDFLTYDKGTRVSTIFHVISHFSHETHPIQKVWQIHQWFDLFFPLNSSRASWSFTISHRASSHLNLRKYHPGIGKWETRFPNHIINRGSQQSGSPSATECGKAVPWEPTQYDAKQHADIQVATTFSFSITDLYIWSQLFLTYRLTNGSFETPKQIVSISAPGICEGTYIIYSCYTSLGEARVNLDSSSFRCSVAKIPFWCHPLILVHQTHARARARATYSFFKFLSPFPSKSLVVADCPLS